MPFLLEMHRFWGVIWAMSRCFGWHSRMTIICSHWISNSRSILCNMSDVQNEYLANYTPLFVMVSCSKAVFKVLHCIFAISTIHSWVYTNNFMKINSCTYNFAQIYKNCPNFFATTRTINIMNLCQEIALHIDIRKQVTIYLLQTFLNFIFLNDNKV